MNTVDLNIIRDTPFIKLNIDIDHELLLKEYKEVEKKYSFENYRTRYWPVRKKYANAWSGICLVSSKGELYSVILLLLVKQN